MAEVVQELLVKFTGNTNSLEKSVASAGAALQKFSTIAIAAAAATGVVMVTAAFKAIDAHQDMAQKVGISTQALGAMGLVARENASDIGALNAALGVMQRNLFAAGADQNSNQGSAIKALGLDIKELLSLRPNEQFEQLAKAISSIENPTVKAGLAAQIFGRNAREVLVLMDDYSDKIREATAFQERFNVTLNDIDSTKVSEAHDAVNRLWDVMSGAANTAALELAPAITAISNAAIDASPNAKQLGVEIAGAMDMAAVTIDVVVAGMNAVSAGILSVAAIAKRAQLVRSAIQGGSDAELHALSAEVDRIDQSIKDYADATNPNRVNSFFNQLQSARRSAEDRAVSSTQSPSVISRGDISVLSEFSTAQDKAAQSTHDLEVQTDSYNTALFYTNKLMDDLKENTRDTFASFVKSVAQGQDALTALRNTALKVIGDIADNLLSVAFGGSAGTGIAGAITGMITNAIGATVTATSGPMTGQQVIPSFDIGTNYVPRDMLANIHQGEMVIPRKHADQIRSGGVGGSVNQTINVGVGVQQTVRAEIMRMLPQLRGVAVAGVADANRRTVGAF